MRNYLPTWKGISDPLSPDSGINHLVHLSHLLKICGLTEISQRRFEPQLTVKLSPSLERPRRLVRAGVNSHLSDWCTLCAYWAKS